LDGVRVVEAAMDVAVDSKTNGIHGSDTGKWRGDASVETSSLKIETRNSENFFFKLYNSRGKSHWSKLQIRWHK
jgi:hypothetical protein